MKMWFALPALLFCSVAVAQGKYRPGQSPVNQNPADYPIKVHVSSTHFRACATVSVHSACGGGVYVDASLNGKKVELFGAVDKHQSLLIAPGDYSAMPQKSRDGGNAALGQAYYMFLSDKSAWSCKITGFSE